MRKYLKTLNLILLFLGAFSIIVVDSFAMKNSINETNLPKILIGVETESFQFKGDWVDGGKFDDNSGDGYLYSARGADAPAATAVNIAVPGNYTLWVRIMDFPKNNSGGRYAIVSLGGKKNSYPFGKTGKEGWSWQKGDVFQLKSGNLLLSLEDNPIFHHCRVDAFLLSNDLNFIPTGTLESMNLKVITPLKIQTAENNTVVKRNPVLSTKLQNVLGCLENEYVKVSFVSSIRDGKMSAHPEIKVNTTKGWISTPLDPSSESYQVLYGGNAPPLEINGFDPEWSAAVPELVNVEVEGTKIRIKGNLGGKNVIWNAGKGHEGIVRTVKQDGKNRIVLDFYPTASGSLQAVWELQPSDKTIRVEVNFKPTVLGHYSLGYYLFNSKSIDEVEELLLPMMVQRKSFPTKVYTLLQGACPTPVSLMQTTFGINSLTWGISADPSMIPFEFPNPIKSHFGMHIRNPQGKVQPSIYGPLIGTPDAQAQSGKTIRLAFRIYLQEGDWYKAYRTIADDVFRWRDYRENGAVSLTQATFNMIDLYMDDEYGGWWDRAKAPYQVESKNGSTQSSPLTPISLYYLTGDKNLYRRRTLPSLEFLLSRDNPHFSPIPENTGAYAKGSMNGPVDIYGSAVYGNLWQSTNGRTPAFYDIAFPNKGIRITSTQQNFFTHNQTFDEWVGRYLLLSEKSSLDSAIRLADLYIKNEITKAPSKDWGLNQFFLQTSVPAWEGLLHLYEVTKEKRFLDAAAYGARLVMTGIWTQPTPDNGQITIHAGGVIHGDKMDRKLYKGDELYRIGFPRKENDTPEKEVAAWSVSNVGLGYEQPATYTYKDNGGRMITKATWASGFLRLALYTGDKQFETYARNAVVGRWANYPGYYYTTFSDLVQNPRYPYEGPDISFIYYHHVQVHLAWLLDYLISDAFLQSKGAVNFPSLRQFGYAFFDYLSYGQAPGEIMGEKNVWLWLRKDLLALNNPQINYLTAHTNNKFFVVLTNQSQRTEKVSITFKPENISKGVVDFKKMKVISGEKSEVSLINNVGEVTLTPRGMMVLQVDSLDIVVEAHRIHTRPAQSKYNGTTKISIGKDLEVRAAAIQVEPGSWDAYVWSNANSGSLKEINLTWTVGNKTETIKDIDYPYEFSVPIMNGKTAFSFTMSGVRSDGSTFATDEMTIGVCE